jgi:uncharacterized protein (DUF58 family)
MQRQQPGLSARRALMLLIAGGVLTLISFLFDAAPLFVPAVAFALLGVLAPAWVWLSARGGLAQRTLNADRIVEEEPLAATIEVRRGWLGLPGAEVFDPFTGSRLDVSGPLSPLRGGRVANVRVVTRFSRRGLHTLGPPSLVVRDPLDLARVETVGAGADQQLLVLPRTEPVRWLTADRTQRHELPDGQAAAEAFAAVDLDGLRPYRPGTPASRIHWPALARGAGLLERRLLADGDTRPLVVLDARGSGAPQLLDAAVRAAASLVLELARGGGCGLLLPGDQRATSIDRELLTWPAAYARLALVQGEPGGSGSRPPALGPLGARLGPMIYVAAEAPEHSPATASATRRGLTVLVLPTQGLADGRPRGVRVPMLATLEVSGCRGFLLGARREFERARPEASAA